MTTIYPINPSAGGGAPPVFNGSNNGLVPNPGGGAANRVLNANGTWAVPAGFSAQTLVMNPSITSGVLGTITWSTTWADPITLSTSVNMPVARMNSNIYNVSLGANAIDALVSASGASMITRNRWGTNLTSITFGAYSLTWNCDFYGTVLANGSWFQIIGGAARSSNNSDILITKLT
jgi:hypothetical protein